MTPEPGQPRILVTGSRAWTDAGPIRTALTRAWRAHGRPITVVHGACSTGADPIADAWATEHAHCGIHLERHPADWARHGRAAGPIRNEAMLDSGIAEVLAFPLPGSRGTAHTIRAATARGIPVTTHTTPTTRHTTCPPPITPSPPPTAPQLDTPLHRVFSAAAAALIDALRPSRTPRLPDA